MKKKVKDNKNNRYMVLNFKEYTKQFTDRVIQLLTPEYNLKISLLESDYNKIANFFFKSLIVFHICFLPFTVSFYMNNYDIFEYLNYHTLINMKIFKLSLLYGFGCLPLKVIFELSQPHVWLLMFLFFIAIWSLVHQRFFLATLNNVTLYFLFYINSYFHNTRFYLWTFQNIMPQSIYETKHLNANLYYEIVNETQTFVLFHPFSQLLILPFLLMLAMVILRKLDISRKQFYIYLQYILINFLVIYGVALLNLFHLKLKHFVVVNLTPTILGNYMMFLNKQKFWLFVPKMSTKTLIINTVSIPRPFVFFDYNHFDTSFFISQIKFFFFNCWFVIDTVTIIFMFLTFLLIALCIVFLWPTMFTDKNFILYISQLVLLLVMLQLTFSASNLFSFFLAFESLLIPMIIMIALWGSKNNRQANNYLIFYTMVSALPLLLAILYLKIKCGTTNAFLLPFFLYKLALSEKIMIWFSLFFAFAVKTPMVPVHIWLPKTHVDAPTVGSVILAGVLLKVGLVGIMRFLVPLFPVLTQAFAPYVMAVATIGVLYASLITLRQIDIKRIIAYSSVAHMNMALVCFFSFTDISYWSTVYLMVSHGLIASGLFFLVGFLYNRFHVRSIYYYSGLATCMPVTAIYFFLFTLANMAFPLTSGFIGEFLLLFSISLNNFYLAFLNSLSLLLTTVYCVLLFGRMFLGELKPWLEQMVLNYIYAKTNNKENEMQLDLNTQEQIILFILLFFIFILGLYPELFFSF